MNTYAYMMTDKKELRQLKDYHTIAVKKWKEASANENLDDALFYADYLGRIEKRIRKLERKIGE